MTASLVLTEAMETIVEETCECLECDRASIFMVDHLKEELWTKVAKGTSTIRIPMNKGIVGHVATSAETLNILNAYADPRFNKDVDRKTNYKTNTILCCPIIDKSNHVLGVVQAINKISHSHFTKDDEGLMYILTNLAGVVLRNSLHYDEQLLFHNSLRNALKTGIYLNSIFSFEELLPSAESRLKKILSVEKAKILLIDQQKQLFYHYTSSGERLEYPIDIGIAGKCAQSAQIESFVNGYNSEIYNGKIDIETSMPLVAAPIINPNTKELIGVFEILHARGIKGMGQTGKVWISSIDYETIEFFQEQLAQAILNNIKWEKLVQKNK